MAGSQESLECPMCGYAVASGQDYVLQLHFEQAHTEDSPFRIQDDPEPLPPSLTNDTSKGSADSRMESGIDEDEDTVMCPEPDCCELVLIHDFNDHLDFHAGERLSFDQSSNRSYHSRHPTSVANSDAGSSAMLPTDFDPSRGSEEDRKKRSRKHKKRSRSNTSSSEKSTLSRSIATFNPFTKPGVTVKPPKSNCRLGCADLGPYAWEDRMPKWLHDQLDAGPKITTVNRIGRDGRLIKQEHVQNETPGIIPILAQLSALDRSVKQAYYCHPSTLHIGKTPKEGSFCGYRNIQMLISYIQGARAQGCEDFHGRVPGILKLQELIESAWDKGINAIARQQTGGIRDTRKYIGTPEAQAIFQSARIDCGVQMFADSKDGATEAHEALLTAVETYFAQTPISDGSNVNKTLLPPIFLQQPGHSMSIIGFERRHDGSRNLIVFDPMYQTSPAMHRLIGRKNIKTARPEVMWAYRRAAKQLSKHAAFEILLLSANPPLYPAWDVLRQFPDCRYVYVFFRSRSLGFDVYPEDYFLRTFPWNHYGGLWIVDDARFARSANVDPTLAHTLRSITGEGASSGAGSHIGTGSSFSGGFLHQYRNNPSHQPTGDTLYDLYPPTKQGTSMHFSISQMPSFSSIDGMMLATGNLSTLDCVGLYSQHHAMATTNMQQQVNFPRLTEVGRRCPGYPTPLSPTLDAKGVFPSPASEAGSNVANTSNTPRDARSFSPMSIDGSDMCGPIHGSVPHDHGQCPDIRMSNNASTKPPLSTPESSPSHPVSPRVAMLNSFASKQALQAFSSQPMIPTSFTPPSSPSSSNASSRKMHEAAARLPRINTNINVIPIADGLETYSQSPISPEGNLLSYKSNRSIESGMLVVQPLSEAQVAEYRFWRPCGKGKCVFGCGAGREGEWAAARRLFRGVEEIREEGEDEVEEEQRSEDTMERENASVDSWAMLGIREMRKEGQKARWNGAKQVVRVLGRERERDGVCDV
ncbi:unnamed protein product [Periconia digitata]|uniref:UFSP1/2/DUB catalytic domain-containing protein n=1 Tax=Periconia digitata TaxID=1303443 RepID=A0A9W4XJD4_9PLEO|nr:unnamed protein product [Periconia digitata]